MSSHHSHAPRRSASKTRTRAEVQAAHAEESRERLTMAAMTALCLAGLLAGWLGDATGLLSPLAVLAAFFISYLAGGFFAARQAIADLFQLRVNVDLLMVAAAGGAAFIDQWREGAILLFLFSLSGTLERYVLGRTRRAIESLMDLAPEEALVMRDGREVRVPVEELVVGDLVRVRPGERIPSDGIIVEGSTQVNQAVLTGESMPVSRAQGDAVFAATLNQQGAIEVQVTQPAGQTALARIIQLVEEAQTERAQSHHFTNWFGERYTLAVLALSALTLAIPLAFLGEDFARAFYRAMTVLVVASPCAVVISIPAALLSAITRAARGGVLFKGGRHLEHTAALKAIAFDKTGTLTLGRPQVTDIVAAEGVQETELLQIAASAESQSEHPLAAAICEFARERGVALLESNGLQANAGRGIEATVEGRAVVIGHPELLSAKGLTIPDLLRTAAQQRSEQGKTVVYVGVGHRVLGLLAIADTLRPEAAQAIRQLQGLGIRSLVMLTGDHRDVAAAIAGELGIDYEAELMPEQKLRVIERLQGRFGTIAMAGDGINDTPALAAADLGISMGISGTDVALETADLVLMADDLRHIPYAIALARKTQRIIRQNLVFAFGVMIVLLAAAFIGHLPLPLAVIGHEGSTVLVILNGLRLLGFRISEEVPAR